jgi:hypothetical protein
LLDAKVQTPNGNWTRWEANGRTGDKPQQAVMQAT